MKKVSLTELEKMYGLSSGTLRYYDQKGILPIFQRTESGQRYVDEADISSVELLIMLKSAGCPLKTIKEVIELSSKSRSSAQEDRKKIHEKISLLLDENTTHRLDDMSELINQIRVSKYLCWFFSQAAAEGSTLIHTKENPPQYHGTIPEELYRFLQPSLADTMKYSEESQGKYNESLKSFQEKYPNYFNTK